MKIKDIESKRGLIKIVQGKGNKDRYVPLPEEILPVLREYYKEYSPDTYLFNGQGSLQYSARSINEFLKKYAKKAKINKNVHCHILRHCYGCHMIEIGTDTALIQRVLGHKNIKTTQIYARMSKAKLANLPNPLTGLAI